MRNEMKGYAETIKEMEAKGWFRVHENNSHIFFAKRIADGTFERTSVEYTK